MKKILFFPIIAIFLTGCAATKDLRRQLDTVSQKFDAAKKENSLLKRELDLCRDLQKVDTRRLFEVRDMLDKVLEADVRANNVWLAVSDRGLDITVSAEKLFVSGGNELSNEGKAFLDVVSAIIQKELPQNYIYVEGHTDNQSLAVFEWKSDWDFSFARALSAVQYMRGKGIDTLRLSAAGFGQNRPRATNDSKEGRRLNRRVEIIVSPQKIGQIG